MGMLDYLFGSDPTTEKSVTVKMKPQKGEAPPEAPIDQGSANLPPAVMEMMNLGQMAQQQPMSMANQPAGLRELENAGSYARRQVQRERNYQQTGLDLIMQMLMGAESMPSYNPYNGVYPGAPAVMDQPAPRAAQPWE